MNWNCTIVLGLMVAVTGFSSAARANVNLDFRPDSQTVAVGDVVNIDVYAVSDSLVDQGFSAGDIVLNWDPAKLNPISYTNAGAGYSWGNSGFLFPTLNGSLSDGNAEWSFERQLFGAIPQATPAGLKLTTIKFTAVSPTTQTTVSMPASLSGRTTRVFDPFIPNTNILGTRDTGAFVTITLPTTYINGTIYLQDTIFGSPFTRNINAVVKQGLTTVGTFIVNSINTSSVAFSGSVSGAFTGPAVIEFDGSSFLKRKVNIVLNNGTMSIGNVNLVNGDVNDDGEVDAVDIDDVIAIFGNLTGVDQDVDVSGEVDAVDIDIVIQNFGAFNDP